MAYEIPPAVFTKEPTKTSFANRTKNNQIDHEARISQNEADISDLGSVVPGPIGAWAASIMRNGSEPAFPALTTMLDITWSPDARYLSIDVGVNLYTNNITGSGNYILRTSDGAITGASSSYSDNWDFGSGVSYNWGIHSRPRLIDYVWSNQGTYAEIDIATRNLKIICDMRHSPPGNAGENTRRGCLHVKVNEVGGL